MMKPLLMKFPQKKLNLKLFNPITSMPLLISAPRYSQLNLVPPVDPTRMVTSSSLPPFMPSSWSSPDPLQPPRPSSSGYFQHTTYNLQPPPLKVVLSQSGCYSPDTSNISLDWTELQGPLLQTIETLDEST